MKHDSEAQLQFKSGMRKLASGVSVVATEWNGARFGLTCTAVCSLSVAPPSLIVCVNRSSASHAALAGARSFSVNVLNERQQSVAEVFAGAGGLQGPAKFAEDAWTTSASGIPVLKGCLASFLCDVVEKPGCATHSVFICLVTETIVEAGDPLIYWASSYRTASSLPDPRAGF